MPTKASLLFDALKFTNDEQRTMSTTVLSRYQDGYQEGIQQMIRDLGRNETARRASGKELRDLIAFTNRDVNSIVNTYDNDLRRKIDALLLGNPDIRLEAAKSDLRQWKEERWIWKSDQVSRASQGNSAAYGRDLFITKNRLTASLVTWDAIPAIIPTSHPECVRRVQRGAVPWSEAENWHLTSPNCRHKKRIAGKPVIKGELWRG